MESPFITKEWEELAKANGYVVDLGLLTDKCRSELETLVGRGEAIKCLGYWPNAGYLGSLHTFYIFTTRQLSIKHPGVAAMEAAVAIDVDEDPDPDGFDLTELRAAIRRGASKEELQEIIDRENARKSA